MTTKVLNVHNSVMVAKFTKIFKPKEGKDGRKETEGDKRGSFVAKKRNVP